MMAMEPRHTLEGSSIGAVNPVPNGRTGHNLLTKDDHVGMVGQLPDDLWRQVSEVCSEVRMLGPREELSKAGEPITHSALLLDGLMARYLSGTTGLSDNLLTVALHVPGDFVDLHGLPLGRLDHDVRTVTAARIALFPHEALEAIMVNTEYARALWRLTMVDAAIHRHWTYRCGRLRALASVADFLCEMDLRMRMCDRHEGDRFPLKLMQSDIAEVSGLSTVHVNRVMKELRDAGLCTVKDGVAHIHDRDKLRQIAGFDPGYLYLPASPSANPLNGL
jgi:CRP-like cAMP-binding protein